MSLIYWSYTDGEGGAFIKFNSTVWFDEPPKGSKMLMGTLIRKKAGALVYYDVGMCEGTFEDKETLL